ncbi:unnamed protein product (macronuclear) [Paramecium tetraurelia]|uniref:Uncharacterized protein n=1 Tax=Paramecium tetraurelia TaxID=5888 RepID=A0DD53_PARTE|nr:uncharacterized protein GSPATT00015829001 [Paramecium tetraurelia]CAK80970.1 unnamed protein product [Paramecium tetraurelia]|eukprot:XP_001448367.1 hypothetical protein (macronuclear) [Paramecium tetraurelia strain d4-2]
MMILQKDYFVENVERIEKDKVILNALSQHYFFAHFSDQYKYKLYDETREDSAFLLLIKEFMISQQMGMEKSNFLLEKALGNQHYFMEHLILLLLKLKMVFFALYESVSLSGCGKEYDDNRKFIDPIKFFEQMRQYDWKNMIAALLELSQRSFYFAVDENGNKIQAIMKNNLFRWSFEKKTIIIMNKIQTVNYQANQKIYTTDQKCDKLVIVLEGNLCNKEKEIATKEQIVRDQFLPKKNSVKLVPYDIFKRKVAEILYTFIQLIVQQFSIVYCISNQKVISIFFSKVGYHLMYFSNTWRRNRLSNLEE